MDPITMAIIGALAKLGESVVEDAYNALKAAIAKKCGVDSEVVEAIEKLEKKPDSVGRKETLKEEFAVTAVAKDSEILGLAQSLLNILEKFEGSDSTTINQRAGDNAFQIGQVSGDVNIKR